MTSVAPEPGWFASQRSEAARSVVSLSAISTHAARPGAGVSADLQVLYISSVMRIRLI